MWAQLFSWMMNGNVFAKVTGVASAAVGTVVGVPITVFFMAANARFEQIDKTVEDNNVAMIKLIEAEKRIAQLTHQQQDRNYEELKKVLERIDGRIYDLHQNYEKKK